MCGIKIERKQNDIRENVWSPPHPLSCMHATRVKSEDTTFHCRNQLSFPYPHHSLPPQKHILKWDKLALNRSKLTTPPGVNYSLQHQYDDVEENS